LRICKIYDGDYPWDVRVQKILLTLVENGYEVHLVCRNKAKRPTYEYLDKVHIHRLPYLKHSGINAALSFPAPINPLWLLTIMRVIRENKTDIVIVRDLPLALAAIFSGRIYGIPIIFDMAEHYPAMVRDMWRMGGFKTSNLITRNPYIVAIVEALSVRWANSILTVVEESKTRLVKQYHLADSKIRVVSNTPRLCDINFTQKNSSRVEPQDTLKLIYIGGLEKERNLEVVLRGMALNGEKLQCSLTILGRGEGEAYYKRIVDRLNIHDKVFFKGWAEHHSIGEFLAMSDVGVIPHAATEHTNSTVPNKLFDYMAYSKSVLASDTAPVKRIIQSESCGLIYRYNSPEDFIGKVRQLLDSKYRDAMGAKGRKAVERKYNWEVDSKELLATLQYYAGKPRISRGM